VLIGGGHASASTAKALRRLHFEGRIVIVGDEAHPPYQRPPLSKDFLLGEADRDALWSAEEDWYAANDVVLRLGATATRIDVETLSIDLSDGTSLPADAVLIATGASPRRLPGDPLAVHYLKTIDDAERLRARLVPGLRIVIVGAGFIGLEIAASARQHGCAVVMIEAAEVPLARALGTEIGSIVANLHRAHGVDLRTGVTVQAVEETADGVIVRTSDGHAIAGDLVLAGIGVVPNDQIARASEITVGNGIRVDEFCRTSANNVFAAGDVANHYHPGLKARLRVEHFDNASRQGEVAARNMLGLRTEYGDVHWFWSDQYDRSLQFAGHAAEWDEIVFRGDVENLDFSAFYLKEGKVVAVFGIDRGADVLRAKALIEGGLVVDPAQLADDDLDLDAILDPPQPEPEEPDAATAASDDAGYVRVARSGQVTEGGVRRFLLEGTEIAVARHEGQVYALHNLCTHLACHLSAGKVDRGGLTCLCHGSIFELATGVPINPPATRPVRTFPVREQDGQIFVKPN
jgi:3-phenylpropionate/trans-cinnamate dioxygenase ferredoxin reductase subunit